MTSFVDPRAPTTMFVVGNFTKTGERYEISFLLAMAVNGSIAMAEPTNIGCTTVQLLAANKVLCQINYQTIEHKRPVTATTHFDWPAPSGRNPELWLSNSNGAEISLLRATASYSGGTYSFVGGDFGSDVVEHMVANHAGVYYLIKITTGTVPSAGQPVLRVVYGNKPTASFNWSSSTPLVEGQSRSGKVFLNEAVYADLTVTVSAVGTGANATTTGDFTSVSPNQITIPKNTIQTTNNADFTVTIAQGDGGERSEDFVIQSSGNDITSSNSSTTKIAGAGDANLDGLFNSTDLTQVFQAGKYETGQAANWSQGDYNGDGLFNTTDQTEAFAAGWYQ